MRLCLLAMSRRGCTNRDITDSPNCLIMHDLTYRERGLEYASGKLASSRPHRGPCVAVRHLSTARSMILQGRAGTLSCCWQGETDSCRCKERKKNEHELVLRDSKDAYGMPAVRAL